MKAMVEPDEVFEGGSLSLKPLFPSCSAKTPMSPTSKARCIRSGWTCTAGLFGSWQISISSSLLGVWRNASWAPRGEVCRRETLRPRACS